MIYYYKIKYYIYKKNIKEILYLLNIVEKFDYKLLKLLIELNEISIINKLFDQKKFDNLERCELQWLMSTVIKNENIEIIQKFYNIIIDIIDLNIIHYIIGTKNYDIFKIFPIHYFLELRTIELAICCYNENIINDLLNNSETIKFTHHTLITIIFKKNYSLFKKVLNICEINSITSAVLYYIIASKDRELFNIFIDNVEYKDLINESVIEVSSRYIRYMPYIIDYINIEEDNYYYLLYKKNYDKLIEKLQKNMDINIIVSLIDVNDNEFNEKLIDNINFEYNDLIKIIKCILWTKNYKLFNKLKNKIIIDTDILNIVILTKNKCIFEDIYNENLISETTKYYAVCSSEKYIIDKVFAIPTFVECQIVNNVIATKKIYLLKKIIEYITIDKGKTTIAFDTRNKKIIDMILSKSSDYVTSEMLCKLYYTTHNLKLIKYIYNKFNINVYSNELIILLLTKSCYDILNKILNNDDIDISILEYCVKYFPYNKINRNSNWIKRINNNKKIVELLLHQNKAIQTFIDDNYLIKEITNFI